MDVERFIDSDLSLGELGEALELAMLLEWATIPPYLVAQWSIRSDPDRTEAVLHHVVHQEMTHLAMVGNVLRAIGGDPASVPLASGTSYPMKSLPGNIDLARPLALRKFDREQMDALMELEHPSFLSVDGVSSHAGRTIGAFYVSIARALEKLNPPIVESVPLIEMPGWPKVRVSADAVGVVDRIRSEGEGTLQSPEQPMTDGPGYSHYSLLREIYLGRKLVHGASGWRFRGGRIKRPELFEFDEEPSHHPEFSKALAGVLSAIRDGWRQGGSVTLTPMFHLSAIGRRLIAQGSLPAFQI